MQVPTSGEAIWAWLFEVPRAVLLLALLMVYSGGFSFLFVVSPLALYGFYAVVIACIAFYALTDRGFWGRAASLRPFLLWILFYCAWGTAAAAYSGIVFPEIVRVLVRDYLVLGAFVAALASVRDLRRLAQLVQLGVIANCLISIWASFDANVITLIAYTLNSGATAFNERRPAGLWSNPNEAAFAFLFGLLLAKWARGPLAWIGRAAALVGILLTVSRSGMYILLLYAAAYGFFRLRAFRLSAERIALGLALLSVASIGLLAAPYLVEGLPFDLSDNWSLQRILDFQERDSGEASRVDVAFQAIQTTLDAPWYGYGAFALQDVLSDRRASVVDVGAHNIYIVVLGETGVVGLVLFLVTLGVGAVQFARAELAAMDRLTLGLMWGSYVIIGLVWHNQLTSVAGMFYAALLFHVPRIAGIPTCVIPTREPI